MKYKIAFVVMCSCLASSGFAATFTDTEFLDSNWVMETLPIGATGQSGLQLTSGGNPGNFRKVTTYSNSFTYMANICTAFVYDPSVSGAISSISWSVDRLNIAVFGAGQGQALLIKQAGKYYTSSFTTSGSNNFSWNTIGNSGLLASNFSENLIDPGVPNFSASGSPITFGYLTSNGNAAGIEVGYDNYNVNITPVPEPATLIILSAGIGSLIRKRKSIKAV